ncbi:MAG: hypothetical protein L0K41_06685, partial [Yaniella sp.]|nr:hypothetical protein [Yaniella sp.]
YQNESRGLRAGQAKSLYRDYRLNDSRVSKVVEVVQILSKVEVQAKIDGAESTITLRWVQMDESAQPVLRGKPGEWTLTPHGPSRFLAILKNNP